MTRPVCAIVGVGPANGAAFARRFVSEGYAVALLARNEQYLNQLSSEIEGTRAYRYDATDPNGADAVFATIRAELGPVEVLVYNAGSGVFGNPEKISFEAFEQAWRVNALGLLAAARSVLADLRSVERGNLVVIGATASLRGGASFAAFAPAKAAQRSLAQSLARHLGPEGIHVSYVVVDGVIDMPRTRELLPDRADDGFLQPADIAESVWFLTRQPRSAWTFELDLRPFCESW